MVRRQFWLRLIEKNWRQRSVVWLSGVRRVGKTCLCHTLRNTEYFDCELPRVRRMMDDPEAFLAGLQGKRVVLDEIHRLGNPSELLKIAADHYPSTRVLATGSSTLGASTKFRDTLTGRKRDVWLAPMCLEDMEDFGHPGDLRRRFLRGGLPPFFLAGELPERDFQEWMDAYWAKDIQELFRLERRDSFQRFAELLLAQSGGIFQATRFAGPCEVSRTTIGNYLKVLEATLVAHVVRPFSARRSAEIVSAPRVYGFDTGFVCYHRGWRDLRREDFGLVWEHVVLNELQANLQTRRIFYWRDKRGHEVDFVLFARGQNPLALECKWSADEFDPKGILAFRRQYAAGENIVVAQDTKRAFSRRFGSVTVSFGSLSSLIRRLSARSDRA
ncbi:ATP-binding protein [Candidatus Sumerlaeota bacterium]|nr:ATP-binding protein [Candidatus Sumerlaeota bacterium]